jgi:hypothetical protein
MTEMIGVVIDSVRVSLTSTQRIVILREADGDRYLPIWIGPYETESISIALQEIEISRPQTHDLIKNILTALDARLTQVMITSLKDDVFFGKLVIESDKKTIEIDSRPSDALAIAVRYNVPIYVDMQILETAGIHAEKDIRSQFMESEEMREGGAQDSTEPDSEGAQRLSVFENFIEKLDLADQPDSSDQKNPDETKPKDDPRKKPK